MLEEGGLALRFRAVLLKECWQRQAGLELNRIASHGDNSLTINALSV